MHGGTLPSLDSASLSVTGLAEYCFRASPLLQKLSPISSQEKSVFLPLKATYLPSPCCLLKLTEPHFICITVCLEVFLNLFREQNKVSRNQVSASKCLVVISEETHFPSWRVPPGSCSKQDEAKMQSFHISVLSKDTWYAHIMLQTGVGSVLFTI